MSPSPIHRDEIVTPSEAKAEVPSGDDDSRITFRVAGQRAIECVVPEMSGTNDRPPSDGEAVYSSTKSEKETAQNELEQEPSPSNVATFAPMVPEEIGSQATQGGRAIRSSSTAARRARRASPYDVEDLRLGLTDTGIAASTTSSPSTMIRVQSLQTPSLDSVKVSQAPTALSLSPQSRSTDDESEEKTSPGSPYIPAAEQAHEIKDGDLHSRLPEEFLPRFMSLTPDLPLALCRYGNSPPKAAERTPRRSFDTEADTSRACSDTGRVGRLIIHEPIYRKRSFRPTLRTRSIRFGTFPGPDVYGCTEPEEDKPVVDKDERSRDTRPWVRGSFDREIDRIIGKIEMLEIMIGFLRKQMDTMGLTLKQLERKSGQ